MTIRPSLAATWLPKQFVSDVLSARWEDHQVLRPIIGFASVDVVDDLARQQAPSEFLFGNPSVFVDAPAMGFWVIRSRDGDVSVAGCRASANPIGVSGAALVMPKNVVELSATRTNLTRLKTTTWADLCPASARAINDTDLSHTEYGTT